MLPATGARHIAASIRSETFVGLSTISLLRKHVPLQTLRLVGGYLRRYHDTPWASLALYVRGREVIFRDPDSPDVYMSAIAKGQKVIPIELQVIARAIGERAQTLKFRRQDQMGKVHRHRYVAHNKPVLAGTRIPTAAVWNLHEAGYSAQRIIAEFPRLGTQDIRAAIQYERKRRRKKAG